MEKVIGGVGVGGIWLVDNAVCTVIVMGVGVATVVHK